VSEATPGNAGRADYPRMIYHPDGRTMQVETAAEEDGLRADGWGQKPSPIHYRPKPSQSVSYGSNDPMAVMFRNILEQVLDERGVGRSPGTAEHVPEMPPRGSHRK
jgi:hypothetical protein